MDINEKAIELHKLWKGKLETTSKVHIMSKEDLSILYTPGVWKRRTQKKSSKQ